ncbi:MAG: tripartite tricarboxylate transporter TctB family protein [Bacillota bacterium]
MKVPLHYVELIMGTAMGMLFGWSYSSTQAFPPSPTGSTIGPALLPRVLSIAGLVLSIMVVVTALVRKRRTTVTIPFSRQLALTVALFTVYLLMLERVGFFVSTLVVMIAELAILSRSRSRWGEWVGIGLLTVVGLWLVFGQLLHVPLPGVRGR